MFLQSFIVLAQRNVNNAKERSFSLAWLWCSSLHILLWYCALSDLLLALYSNICRFGIGGFNLSKYFRSIFYRNCKVKWFDFGWNNMYVMYLFMLSLFVCLLSIL